MDLAFYFFCGIVYMSVVVFMAAAIMLFVRYRSGDNSRHFLSLIFAVSAVSILPRLIYIATADGYHTPSLSAPLLIYFLAIILTYSFYPISIITPRWLNMRRLAIIYSPVVALYGVYLLSLLCGVEQRSYYTIVDILNSPLHFSEMFQLVCFALLIIAPCLIAILPRKAKDRGIHLNRDWIFGYVIVLSVLYLSFYATFFFESICVHTLFYGLCIAGCMTLLYVELFVRLIYHKELDTKTLSVCVEPQPSPKVQEEQHNLPQRVVRFMTGSNAWCDPDFTLNTIAQELYTNRTSLSSAIREAGYESFTSLVNQYRIEAFISLVRSNQTISYMDAFYTVGYRSRKTALQNFRKIENMTPTEYFKMKKVDSFESTSSKHVC